MAKLKLIAKQHVKINDLQLELDMLKEATKSDLYKSFMKKLNESLEIEKLREENTKLRKQVKELKELLKVDNER